MCYNYSKKAKTLLTLTGSSEDDVKYGYGNVIMNNMTVTLIIEHRT